MSKLLEDMRKKRVEHEFAMDINENIQILYLKQVSAKNICQMLLMIQKLLALRYGLRLIFSQKIDVYF